MRTFSVTAFLAASADAYSIGFSPNAAAALRSTTLCMAAGDLKVGVLAIQGGFAEHVQALERQTGVEAVEVRSSYELNGCDALILPGGESTAIGHGLVDAVMLDDIKEFCSQKPVRARAAPQQRQRG